MTTPAELPIGELTIYILVKDDAVRDALGQLLTSTGYRAVPFSSALSFLAENPTAGSACVLAEIRTPGMDGLQLQEQVVARRLDLPVILMTGPEDVSLAVRAMRAGASDFLERPFEEKRVLESIESALYGREPMAESEANTILGAMAKLTAREKEVLDLLVIGCADKIIARPLTISPPTVEIHRGRIMEKMKARNMAELVRNILAVRPDR